MLWLTELEKSTPVFQIKDSVWDSAWTSKFDMKHMSKGVLTEMLWA